MAGNKVLASAARSASYNMVLQLVLRLLTFVLNAFTLRIISKEVLGVVNVRLMLLYTTTLFVSREAFRRACLTSNLERRWRKIVNLLWCIIPLGFTWSCIFGVIWAYHLEQPDPSTIPHYRVAVLCYCEAIVIELLAEPLFICGQMLLFVRAKVVIEGLSLVVRCVTTVFLLTQYPHFGLLAFSIAQILQSICITVMYYGYFIYYIHTQKDEDFPFKETWDLLPQKVPGKPLISWSLARLTWSFFKQSFLKQILTEGERYIMTVFDVLSFGDQGVYDVINNLGSLVARFLFLPLEDSGYLFFTQTLQRGTLAKHQKKEAIALASDVFHYLLKVVTMIGLVIVTFGYPYSFLALDLYGGQVLSSGSGPILLRCYCVYVLLLAVNGITECFTFATMGQKDIDKYNHKMLVFSGIFLASTWYLTGPLGSLGFILANCFNMAARIAHSLYYTNGFYKDSEHKPLRDLIPSSLVLLVYKVAFIATVFSEVVFCCDHGWLYRVLHIAVGGACLLILLGVVYLSEQNLVQFVKRQYLSRVIPKAEDKQPIKCKRSSENKKEL